MHELGVVFYVVKDVKKVAEENHVEKVSAVTLEIGKCQEYYMIICRIAGIGRRRKNRLWKKPN